MLHPADIPNNLPESLRSFVGRARAIGEIDALLQANRLVTLVGMGGVGKTRLALQVAGGSLERFAGGAWLVELGPVHEGRRVGEAIASVLGVRDQPGETLEAALARRAAGREILVILDNCEHVLEGAACAARDLMAAGRGVRVLATSREPLRVAGEATFLVPGLAVPREEASRDAIAHAYSVRLFVDRVRAASPYFELSESNAPAIGTICRLLDGIPLALEIAAARMRWMPPARIAAELRARLQRLGDTRAPLPRRRILRATIDWSHELLDEDERVLLRRLAVFAGGWTVEAAEDVCRLQRDAATILASLADRSLVVLEKDGRYRMLETVREYALRRLADAAEAEAVAERHLDYYARLAATGRRELAGPGEAQWLARFDAERDNIRAALAWSAGAPGHAVAGLKLANAMKLYWMTRGQLHSALAITVEALERATDAPAADRAQALFNAGQIRYFMGRHGEACACLEESLAIARGLGDAFVAAVLQPLGMAALALGDLERARRSFEEASRLACAGGNKAAMAGAMNALAMFHRVSGDTRAARRLYDDVVRLARESGNDEVEATGLLNLAMVALEQGLAEDASTLLLAAMRVALATASAPAMQSALDVSAALAAMRGDARRAARFAGAAAAHSARTGVGRDAADAKLIEPRLARARALLGDADFGAAEIAGRRCDAREALREAQAWLGGGPVPADDRVRLTASR